MRSTCASSRWSTGMGGAITGWLGPARSRIPAAVTDLRKGLALRHGTVTRASIVCAYVRNEGDGPGQTASAACTHVQAGLELMDTFDSVLISMRANSLVMTWILLLCSRCELPSFDVVHGRRGPGP